MAKRFTDTEKWKKQWIRALPTEYKLVWIYLLDDCNHAGIWDVDIDVLKLKLGIDVTEESILKAFNGRVQVINSGHKWFIPKFIEFQYGELDPNIRPHSSVIDILKKEGVYKGYKSPLLGRKDKDKAKDKDKNNIRFDEIWNRYPSKLGRKTAERHFYASVRTQEDWLNINKALDNYLKSNRVAQNIIQNGSTWFNQWQDWVDFKEKVVGKAVKKDVEETDKYLKELTKESS